MKVAKKYSHLNGEEWLLVHEKGTYQELLDVIEAIDAEKCRTKISKERGRQGKALYSPVDINSEFDQRFSELGWHSTHYSYYVAHDIDQLETMTRMSFEEQKEFLQEQNADVILSYNQTDHVKNRVAIEIQFGKYAFVAYDLFVKHLAFYTGRIINVGIEILPTKAMVQKAGGLSWQTNDQRRTTDSPKPLARWSPVPVWVLVVGRSPDLRKCRSNLNHAEMWLVISKVYHD